jgi:hypothetical protein
VGGICTLLAVAGGRFREVYLIRAGAVAVRGKGRRTDAVRLALLGPTRKVNRSRSLPESGWTSLKVAVRGTGMTSVTIAITGFTASVALLRRRIQFTVDAASAHVSPASSSLEGSGGTEGVSIACTTTAKQSIVHIKV